MEHMDVYEITQANRPYICFDHAQRNREDHTGLRRTNFSGRPDNFGNTTKTFQIQITPDMQAFFEDEGIKVDTWLDTRTQEPIYCVDVYIDYRHTDWYPVDVYLVEKGNETYFNEEDLHMLDAKDFENVALMCRKKPKYNRARQRIDGQYSLYLAYGKFFEMVNPFMEAYGPKRTSSAPAKESSFSMPEPEATDDEEIPFS